MTTASLPSEVTDTGYLIIVLAALAAFIGAVGAWFRHVFVKAVDERIQPIHDRINDHMDEVDAALRRVAISLEIIANHVNVKIPDSAKP